jgi:hypothetical protein
MGEVGFGISDAEIYYATTDQLMPPIYGHIGKQIFYFIKSIAKKHLLVYS